jgi:hypothetical protein
LYGVGGAVRMCVWRGSAEFQRTKPGVTETTSILKKSSAISRAGTSIGSARATVVFIYFKFPNAY